MHTRFSWTESASWYDFLNCLLHGPGDGRESRKYERKIYVVARDRVARVTAEAMSMGADSLQSVLG